MSDQRTVQPAPVPEAWVGHFRIYLDPDPDPDGGPISWVVEDSRNGCVESDWFTYPDALAAAVELDANDPAPRPPATSPRVDIHTWFGLTYSNYLVLPRSVLQSMPVPWQYRLTELLGEAEAAFGHLDWPTYDVRARGERGRYRRDPIPHYNRGRTRLEPRGGDV